MTQSRQREIWIDVAKALAICAVVLDHTIGGFSSLGRIIPIETTFFSVSLFVLIGGYNAASSQIRRIERGLGIGIPWRGICNLVIPYLLAVAVYQMYETRQFDLMNFLTASTTFNQCAVFYFVAFYLQLLLLSPVLLILSRTHICLFLPLVFGLACLCTSHTTFMEKLHGGGRMVLGGYFLFTFYLGVVAAQLKKPKSRILFVLAAVFAVIVWILGTRHGMLMVCPRGEWLSSLVYQINPAGLRWMLYSAAVFTFVWALRELLIRRQTSYVVRVMVFVGRASIAIFLYHVLVLMWFLRNVPFRTAGTAVAAFALEVGLPTLGYFVVRQLMDGWRHLSANASGCAMAQTARLTKDFRIGALVCHHLSMILSVIIAVFLCVWSNVSEKLDWKDSSTALDASFFNDMETKYDHSSNYELVRKVSSDTVAMHPWTTPSTLTLHPNGRYRSVHLDFSSQNVQGDVMFSILRDGVEFRREHVLGGQKVGLDLPLADVKTLVFSVDCNGSVNYDSCVLTVSDIQLKEEK